MSDSKPAAAPARPVHDPILTRADPAPGPDDLQRLASDPATSVWVGASAGTGKTKVLTDRVLRLLLPRANGAPGTVPEKILCLTFTKAAASEMALRIGRELGRWTVLPDEDLDRALGTLLGRPPQSAERTAARQLFARIVDRPDGLKIMTIHSFCKSILSRFPLEAGLHPGFEVIEDGEADRLLRSALDHVLTQCARTPDHPLAFALDTLAAEQTEDQFRDLLTALCKERRQLEALSHRFWGIEGIYTEICGRLGITPGLDRTGVIRAACTDGPFEPDALRRAAKALLAGGGVKDAERGLAIAAWLEAAPEARFALYPSYRAHYFTKKDEEMKSLAIKAAQSHDPQCEAVLRREAAHLAAVQERVKSAECANLTRSLLALGLSIIQCYQDLKARRGALDYDDLVLHTLDLLSGRSLKTSAADVAPWIMYKLDDGLDHILIDEAQDTNPEQWDIIGSLCGEFFAGLGSRGETVRTLFSVGDRKQSIFSFQRAAPDRFAAMQTHFARHVQAAGQRWTPVEMQISFRSTDAVLSLVDAVFASPQVREGVSNAPIVHHSHRVGQSGLVELWPVFETPDSPDEADPWAPPVHVQDSRSGAARLADHIARTIRDWIDRGEWLPARGRSVRAGDIMILMRTRSAFVGQMVRALKLRGIPVSGVDRMVLADQLAVQDLLALASFALLPEDDLSLACALKSPLIGLDEDALFALCHGRKASLWAAVRDQAPPAVSGYLAERIVRAGRESPYAFFAALLHEACPADPEGGSGLKAIRSRLGDEALDPLDEFLNAALAFERSGPATVQGFVQVFSRPQPGLKRQTEESADCVRIMTVHGAKGLQAPIVILPDTLRTAASRRVDRLLWPDRTGLSVPLWTPRAALAPALYRDAFAKAQDRDDAEYRRLLYVALTRAEDRLYVCGYQGEKKPLEESWYPMVAQAFSRLNGVYCGDFNATNAYNEGRSDSRFYRFTTPQSAAPDRFTPIKDQIRTEEGETPWLRTLPPLEPTPPRPLAPSRPSEPDPPVLSPLAAIEDDSRFRRGILTHRLLERLPELPEDHRAGAATAFLNTQAPDLPPAMREAIATETLAILTSPAFSPLFGPGSLAEVPVTGLLADGRLVSGQIDRLLITDSEIWIVDYKTNRPSPRNAADTPAAYRAQLRAYRDTLARIWPDRAIRTFLLWTDGPYMMELAV